MRWGTNVSCQLNFRLCQNTLCTSQFHLRPAPPRADPRALGFFLPWMANSRGWGLLSCQISWGGDGKRGQMPCPTSTLQHFSLIAQSNSAILSILMCDFLGVFLSVNPKTDFRSNNGFRVPFGKSKSGFLIW